MYSVTFFARKLSAFAGLRALRHLDFELLRVDQVIRRHAEAPGSHLLDLVRGVRLVAIQRRIFAAFAGVAAAAELIHRQRQRAVRFQSQANRATSPAC